jgi:hypothetical protein
MIAQTQPWAGDCHTIEHGAVCEIYLNPSVVFLDYKLLYPMQEGAFRQYQTKSKTRNRLIVL